MCPLSWNLGASTSWNPQGLSRPVMGLFYLYSRQNINGCKRVLVEAHYHTVLIFQYSTFMLVDFMYSRILTFQWYQWWRSIPILECCSCMAFFKYNALGWHLRATTYRSLILDMNCILLYFIECICWLINWLYWCACFHYTDFTDVRAFIILTLLMCVLSLYFLPQKFLHFYTKWILWDFNSRWADVQWLNRDFETFFIISSGSLMHFDRLFGFLICS